jgi:putative endonuclease
MKRWHVYIIRCSDASLYTGIATDVPERLAKHDAGKGAKYTRGRGPVALAYCEAAKDESAAKKREAEIKRLSRAKKEEIVKYGPAAMRQANRKR